MAGDKRADKRRLRLVPETLRTLWIGALEHVNGGKALTDALTAISADCNSAICSIGRDCRIGGE
jgi:hypothetical protein